MAGYMLPHKLTMKLTNLPTDVLSCIIQHLQQDAGQRDQTLDDIAALRSVCRSLRLATDLLVTHANFRANTDVAELRSMTRRCPGDQGGTCLKLQACGLVLHPASAKCRQRTNILHRTLQPHQHTFYCLISSQVCSTSYCSSLCPTPLPQPWRRWLH